ncbi:MAG: tyrosine--tRNA ligase [Candidatus Omnitrophica bacterium]|nr:tyrosine--tRNA ligase [Candidatus Omnitrophota bacterium]
MSKLTINEQLSLIKRGVSEIISEEELIRKLETSVKEKRPLRIKAGFDPSAPDIHLGHTVLLRKLRHFQDCGHEVFFLIGDFTARIGDPSGKSETRPALSAEEVEGNAATYTKQAFKILRPEATKVVFNNSWFSKMQFADIFDLASRYTVARILERDDFTKRIREGRAITMLEFLYPLLQGYDSVFLKADVELGGTDQKFNLLVGRDLQREYAQEPQVVMTVPLLVGTDGVDKMSKSLGNHIGIDEKPAEMFGKVMSISDELMWNYYELLTDSDLTEVKSLHPLDAKKRLAMEIVRGYHGPGYAERAREEFERVFSRRELPTENRGSGFTREMFNARTNSFYLPKFLVGAGLAQSTSEARRKIEEGALRINGAKYQDAEIAVDRVKVGDIFQIGKLSAECNGIDIGR